MSTSTETLIASEAELGTFLSSIPLSCTLYLDLEGTKLSRHGTISLITILVHPQGATRLIDVLTLGKLAFTTTSQSCQTLKSILEDPSVPKCLWDVRNDADTLWALYNVGLDGVTDIQLLENASRVGDKEYIRGLDKCVQSDLKPGFMELNRWIRTKKDIQRLMPANIFATRPMDPKTIQYCVNDVAHLPCLHDTYQKRIKGDWLAKVMTESASRVKEAHSPDYEPQSPTKTLGPWGSGTEKRRPTLDELLEELDDQRLENLARDQVGHYDEFLEELDDQRIEILARDQFGLDDDVGYYDDYSDGGGYNAADGALFPEYFDSCWDKGS